MISEYRMAFRIAIRRLPMGRDLVGNCSHELNLLGATACHEHWDSQGKGEGQGKGPGKGKMRRIYEI